MKMSKNLNCRLRNVSMQTSCSSLSDVLKYTGVTIAQLVKISGNVFFSHLHMAIVNQQTNIKQKATTKYTTQFNAITGSTLLRGYYSIFKSISGYNTFSFPEYLKLCKFYAALQMKITIKTTIK